MTPTDSKFATALSVLTAPVAWRDAAAVTVRTFIEEGQPFSSGEVVAVLRNHDGSLRFSSTRVGEYCRDLFYSQQMPQYMDDGMGQPTDPVQVSRITQGKFPTRTPAGVEVFVYGPNQSACDAHEFEIFIPQPGECQADAPTAVVTPPMTPTVKAKQIAILGAKVAVMNLQAHCRPDGRLEIPRNAFEACVHLGGQPMKGGDPVFVKVEPAQVIISQIDPEDGSKSYSLTTERGRVLIPGNGVQFAPGKTYPLQIGKGTITIPLV